MKKQLVELAQGGDDAAFCQLVDADGDRCYAIAFRILRDAALAEDAVQQALLLAWRELPRLRNLDRYETWLYRLLVNACYAELRRFRRWKDRTTVLPLDGPAGPDPYVDSDERDALERAFARLSPDRRAAFVLHHDVATLALMADRGIAWVPTLAALEEGIRWTGELITSHDPGSPPSRQYEFAMQWKPAFEKTRRDLRERIPAAASAGSIVLAGPDNCAAVGARSSCSSTTVCR